MKPFRPDQPRKAHKERQRFYDIMEQFVPGTDQISQEANDSETYHSGEKFEASDYIAGEGDKCVIETNDLVGPFEGIEATHELSNCFADARLKFGDAET
ncbi:MAG: hypothetical protein LQ342_008321 [Letrouitia transgressa]|nr:MAG: hypothetical protein LQ342_008321 [Letrouitia transgressa]